MATLVDVVAAGEEEVVVAGGSVVVAESSVLVRVGSAFALTHAETATTKAIRSGRRRIKARLWHDLAPNARNLTPVFGPLNGVRTALVIAAALAALVSLIAGHPGAAAILGLGIAIHGLGWLYLYTHREHAETD